MLHLWTGGALSLGVPPHMECTWSKALRGPQVITAGLDSFTHLVISVLLNGRQEDWLVNAGCGQTLVWQAEGTSLAEILVVFMGI